MSLDSFLLCRTLRLQHNALQFLKDGEGLVGVINLGVPLLFGYKEADFLKALQLALDVAGVFFNELGKSPHMRLEIRIFCVNHDDFTAYSRCDKYV